jgi:carboxylesterase
MTLLALPLAWLAADACHGLWVAARRTRWERRQRRGPDGLIEGAEAYTLGSGPDAVLFVHGFADTPAVFRSLARDLAAAGGVTCRAMRLPGAAEPAGAAARATLADWRAAVRREALELRRRHERLWLLGHSLGAALVLDAAAREPDLVRGAVLLAPLLRVSRARSPLLPPRAWFGLARAAFPFSRTFESCFSADVEMPDDPELSYRRDRFVPFATYRNLFALLHELGPAASAFRLPACVVLADADRVVDNAATRAWFGRSAAQPLVWHTLADTPHPIPTEPGGKSVTAWVRSFMLSVRTVAPYSASARPEAG